MLRMNRYWFLILLLSFVISATAIAAVKIVNVDFNGLATVSERVVRSRISSIEGTPYTTSAIKKDIKSLYKTGLFKDVQVQKQNIAGGVKIIFTVVEKRTVGKLTIQGNKKIKTDKLQDVLQIHALDQLDSAKIAKTRNAIYKLYEEKGYFLADIKTKIEPYDLDKNQVELVIQIDENKSVKIRRIKFIGNHVFSDKKLRSVIRTKEKGFLSFITESGKLENEKLNTDLQMLRFHYLDNGFIKIKVEEPLITLTRDKQSIYITIPVREGKKYKVNNVRVAGDILTTEEELLSQLKTKKDSLYRKSLEIQDLQTLEKIYGDQAYAFANIYPHFETDDNTLKADITYYIQKGPKVKVEKIIIKGNEVTRDKVIRREMKLIENAWFSQSALERSRARLYQLGYFETINIATPRGSADNFVNIVIDVVEKNTGTISVGAGFSTLESFIFTATVQKENFFGLGWSGGVSANISKLRQDIMLSLSDRYFLDSKWYFGLTFQRFMSQLNRDFDQNRFGGTVTFGRELMDFFHMRVGYMIDDIEVLNFSSQVPQFFQDNASGLTSAVFGSLIYDRRDNRVSTKKGFYSSIRTEYSTHYLGASNNYVQVTADNRVYFKLPLNLVLKGRGMFGYINSLDSNPVPLFNRFFLGGVNTLRGYDINSVGPELNVPQNLTGGDSSFVYGGNKMLLFNTELEIPVYAKGGFFLVGFLDAGNSYGESQNIDLSSLRYDYGFGVRWHSPMGPLRFEWGFPINKKEGESGLVFNFTIGQSF
ncbi:MAG: outer membrane protein assembly factor BamA [bacterium]|nr:outer membrane protein assembly factor BamA [bacterium]MBU1916613.1 outer membrane protein assembly factor BamA [bacterium]